MTYLNTYIRLENRAIAFINPIGSVYDQDSPRVRVFFSNNRRSKEEVNNFVSTHLTFLQDRVAIQHLGPKRPDGSLDYMICFEGKNYRTIIDTLLLWNQINQKTRSLIEPSIREMDTTITRRQIVSDKINNADKDVIESLIDPLVEDLFITNTDLTLILQIFISMRYMTTALTCLKDFKAFYCNPRYNHIWQQIEMILLSTAQQDIFIDSLWALSLVYYGKANIENIFEKQSHNIPKLELQQKFILDFIFKKIIQKFNITDKRLKFVVCLCFYDSLDFKNEYLTNLNTLLQSFFSDQSLISGDISKLPFLEAQKQERSFETIKSLDHYLLVTNNSFDDLELSKFLSPKQLEVYRVSQARQITQNSTSSNSTQNS